MKTKETTLAERILVLIKEIPRGKVASYGQIADLAGNPRAARVVAWLLHSSSEKRGLPWHRVINAQGKISLPAKDGGVEQLRRLKREGVHPGLGGKFDFKKYGWR